MNVGRVSDLQGVGGGVQAMNIGWANTAPNPADDLVRAIAALNRAAQAAANAGWTVSLRLDEATQTGPAPIRATITREVFS